MTASEEMLSGSFRGVTFLIRSSDLVGGRKKVLKTFPNSDRQSVEDLGKRQRSYNVSVIITEGKVSSSGVAGSSYFSNRDEFITALEKEGVGTLIHPFFGRVENIVAMSFSLTENITDLGIANFNIQFEVRDTDGLPQAVSTSSSKTSLDINFSTITIQKDVGDNFNVSSIFPSNFTASVTKVNDIVTAFRENTSFLSVEADAINDFTNQLAIFSNNVVTLISSPVALSAGITDLYNSVNRLYSTADNTLEIFQRFFDFGENDTNIVETTVPLAERNINNSLLNGIMQAQALNFGYLNAIQIVYETVDEVERVADLLEVQYQLVIANNNAGIVSSAAPVLSAEPRGLSNTTLQTITEVRAIVQEFFNEQKLTASQIIDISTPLIPARALAYSLYGSSEFDDVLISLNRDSNVTFFKGDLKAVTE